MNKPNQSITGITEIALRVHDLDLMRRFYEQVIGLEVLRDINDSNGRIIFYAVGEGNEHLALFEEKLMDWFTRDKSPQIDPKLTTLSHFAIRIALEDFESEKKRIEQLGIEIMDSDTSSWLHCRMFYFSASRCAADWRRRPRRRAKGSPPAAGFCAAPACRARCLAAAG